MECSVLKPLNIGTGLEHPALDLDDMTIELKACSKFMGE
jgi:hypothetical protein